MPQIAPVRTPYSIDDAKVWLADAWMRRFGEPVRDDVLRLMLALIDVETGDGVPGNRVMPNSFHHNMGNLVISSEFIPTTQRDYFVLKGDEGPGTGSKAKEHFYKAFTSFEQSADEQVAQLTRDTRPHWRDGLLTGNPEQFIRALNGQNGPPAYFEAGFDRYLKTFMTRWNKYPLGTPGEPGEPPADPDPDPDPNPDAPFPFPPVPRIPRELAERGTAVGIAFVLVGAGMLWAFSRAKQRQTG